MKLDTLETRNLGGDRDIGSLGLAHPSILES